MTGRSLDWIAPAEASAREERHEQAVKGLHLHLGQEAWGQMVAKLLSELPIPADRDLLELPVPAEILVYTSGEWERMHREKGRFASTLAREARWLFPG